MIDDMKDKSPLVSLYLVFFCVFKLTKITMFNVM